MRIRVNSGNWFAIWGGGRLMDVHHVSKPSHALDCVQVGAYDWQRGTLMSEPSRADLKARLEEWITEQGECYEREALPYV